jgi:hypothetical protein
VAKANELWPLGKDFRPSVMTSGNPVQLSSAWLKAFSGTWPSGQHRYTKSGRNLHNKINIEFIEKSSGPVWICPYVNVVDPDSLNSDPDTDPDISSESRSG